MDLTERALLFATAAHAAIGQRRKYTDTPYIEHPIAVAAIVASVTDDPQMIAAAYLHDVVEDTKVPLALIAREFGNDVAALVEELTDVSKPEDGNRATRRALDRTHSAAASARGQTIKVADLIDNSYSIVARDPAFAATYMQEKAQLLDVLVHAEPALLERAGKIMLDYENGLRERESRR